MPLAINGSFKVGTVLIGYQGLLIIGVALISLFLLSLFLNVARAMVWPFAPYRSRWTPPN